MKDILVSYLLDRSGSMSLIWRDTLGGLDGFIKEQADLEGNAWVSLFAFDWTRGKPNFEIVYEAWNAKDIPSLVDDNKGLLPRGGTPLLDSIAKTIHETQRILSERPWFDGEILVVIQTDGYENSSREFSQENIKKLIADKESEGWKFLFMGAGIDAISEGAAIGLNTALSYRPNSVGTASAYNTISRTVTGLRSTSELKVDSDT